MAGVATLQSRLRAEVALFTRHMSSCSSWSAFGRWCWCPGYMGSGIAYVLPADGSGQLRNIFRSIFGLCWNLLGGVV